MKRKVLISVFFILFTFTLICCQSISTDADSIFSKTKPSNWVIISYGSAVDKSTLTHSGERVGNVIQKIPSYDDDYKGLVQQYLEPYSILCHDVLLYNIKPDTPPLINILAHYPIGSEQPAWVDLFREGHFQLYYNPQLIRIFLKGDNPENIFEKYQSVIRHPIQDLINSKHLSIKNIEVYVFNNDYAKAEIRVNIIPATSAIDDLDLSPKHRPIDLGSIEEFLNHGVALEAVEVDERNDIFFYGRSASDQTIAGQPVSISDIAVIYRSIFHYGYNAPYISLDTHEDNRYAKVNFGGHLENTRVGHVVLEADKLFKTLSTGIDPNTHEFVKSKITKHVPDFLTEDERGFLEDVNEENTQVRYWFYPDEIGTVTNGSIGVVQKNQFLADAERMDVEAQLDKATRKTIDHLNKYFIQYEKAENTYKELNTVGRMMALVNWLKEMNIDDRVELDDLLSVKMPAFSMPEKTKKMLAITAIVYPGDLNITNQNVRDYTKTYYLSHLLDKYSPSTSDKEFLEIADNHFSQVDIAELYPPYKKLEDQVDDYGRQINSKEKEIELLYNEIERKKDTLDMYSSSDIDQYNNLINKYNSLLENQESVINVYNAMVTELNNMNIITGEVFSIGGGISLNPREFKQIVINKDSPAIREIVKVKSQLKFVGNIFKSGDWIRSNATNGESRINKLPDISWTSSKSENGSVKYDYRADSGDFASVEFSKNLNYVQYNINMNAYNDIIKYYKEKNLIEVTHDIFPQEYKGEVSSDGKRIVFSK
ncbi:MAG: hypothetical protein L6305_03990 [Actinomycetia bacterium]|nr:hypothetical protein [Actinomycetes bacterium]